MKFIRTVLKVFFLCFVGLLALGIFFVMPLPRLPSVTCSDFVWAHLGDKFSQRHLAISYLLAAAQGHDSYLEKARYWEARAKDNGNTQSSY